MNTNSLINEFKIYKNYLIIPNKNHEIFTKDWRCSLLLKRTTGIWSIFDQSDSLAITTSDENILKLFLSYLKDQKYDLYFKYILSKIGEYILIFDCQK